MMNKNDGLWQELPVNAIISPRLRAMEAEFTSVQRDAQRDSWSRAEHLIAAVRPEDRKALHAALCTVNNLTLGKWTKDEQNLVREYLNVLEREASYQDSPPTPNDKT